MVHRGEVHVRARARDCWPRTPALGVSRPSARISMNSRHGGAILIDTLPELAAALSVEDIAPDASPWITMGAGRNCTVFDELRYVAYREVREFKRAAPQSFEAFRVRLERVALGINLQFSPGLMISEI